MALDQCSHLGLIHHHILVQYLLLLNQLTDIDWFNVASFSQLCQLIHSEVHIT